MSPGCNAADANSQEDTVKSPTFINTVKNVNSKANTNDHLAGLNTENNNFQPCKPILEPFALSLKVSVYLTNLTKCSVLLIGVSTTNVFSESNCFPIYNGSSRVADNCPKPDVTRSLK